MNRRFLRNPLSQFHWNVRLELPSSWPWHDPQWFWWIIWYGRKWWCKTWAFSRLMMNSTKGANSNGNADKFSMVHVWFGDEGLTVRLSLPSASSCSFEMNLAVDVALGMLPIYCGWLFFRLCGVPMHESDDRRFWRLWRRRLWRRRPWRRLNEWWGLGTYGPSISSFLDGLGP